MPKYCPDAPGAPKAIGPYSQAVESMGLLFLSGQIPLDPLTGEIVQGGFEAQTRQVIKNIEAVLKANGCGFQDVVSTRIYVTDLKNFQSLNVIYEAALAGSKPARATIQVAGLPRGSEVEIELVAELRK
jgi:2-iminobutanoate/2-iminopropanoate deaminase